jgi:hypothetical protein
LRAGQPRPDFARQFIPPEIRFVKMRFQRDALSGKLQPGGIEKDMRFSQRRVVPRLRVLLVVAAGVAFAGDVVAPVPFPAEYRQWAVARSLVVGPENKSFATIGGFHHYYANEKALEGFRTGQFPDGSVVVDERLEARQEAGTTFEGPKRYLP